MSGVARRPAKAPGNPVAPGGAGPQLHPQAYAPSTDSGERSDPEGQDMESDEYGSAEHSGSENSDRDSVGAQDEDNLDDSNNQGKPQTVDHDEDRRNPQYIPKKGTFYEHDDRTAAGGENENADALSEGVQSIELSRVDRNNVPEGNERNITPALPNERRRTPKSNADRWLHDKYNENDQAPKSSDELMSVYGYDIRGEEGPPKALRRHRYNRGPNKYTRNWEDENAYGKINNVSRSKQPPSVTNGKEFPALQAKNDKNRPIDKRKRIEKKVRVVESKVSPDKNANDKIIHDNKVFINKTNKSEKEIVEKKQIIEDSSPRWKNRVPPKMDLRKPTIVMKTQVTQPEQIKWPEAQRVGSPPKTLPLVPPQARATSPTAAVPLQENKLPSARKVNQSQVLPRMQVSNASSPAVPPATAMTTTAAPSGDSSTRGKRYSSLRQRPMPDTYQTHQQQYNISEYQQQQQQLPKQTASQQTISNIAPLPHQQTPPPLQQSSSQHHQSIPQMHQQTPPPSLPQMHQQTTQIHQQSSTIHQHTSQLHQQPTQIIQQNSQQIHQQSQQIHQPTAQIHQQNAQLHQQNAQMHQQSAQQLLQQQSSQIHQASAQLHPQTPPIHQQTPPPAMQQPQAHHQTPPPAHQSLSRQQPSMPMRQVPRTHQQQITIHSQQISMAMPQGGLVSSQTYPTPQLMTQNQYIQSPNGTVYGHVVPQVYPPPQAYPTPQHQPITPQGIPPQALPPQALPPQPMPPQAMPPQAIPPQAMPQHSYHHQTPAPQHQYPAHVSTGRSVFREPSGITYYSPQEQKGTAPPTRRPTNAIPIVPPPPKERGKQSDSVPPPANNIDHIIDNMFVPRQGRMGPTRSSETPPRSLESLRSLEDIGRHSEDKIVEEKQLPKENTSEISLSRVETQSINVETTDVISNLPEPELKPTIESQLENQNLENESKIEEVIEVIEPVKEEVTDVAVTVTTNSDQSNSVQVDILEDEVKTVPEEQNQETALSSKDDVAVVVDSVESASEPVVIIEEKLTETPASEVEITHNEEPITKDNIVVETENVEEQATKEVKEEVVEQKLDETITASE